MTVVSPPMLMKIYISNVAANTTWPSDGTSYAGYPYKWTVVMSVTPQSTSYPNSNTPYYFNGLDISAGQWISNEVAGGAWLIDSVVSKTATSATIIVEDVNQYNTYNDPTGNGSGSPASLISGFIFTVSSANIPILSAVTPNVLTSQWQTDLLSRFAYINANTAIVNAIAAAIPSGTIGSLLGTTGSNTASIVTVGSGLSLVGGVLSTTSNSLSADGTTIHNTSGVLSVAYGTTANTAVQGNDTRVVNALSTSTAASTYSTIASAKKTSMINSLIFG